MDFADDGVFAATEEEMMKEASKGLNGEERKKDKTDDLVSRVVLTRLKRNHKCQ